MPAPHQDDVTKDLLDEAFDNVDHRSLAAAGGPYRVAVLCGGEDFATGTWGRILAKLGKTFDWTDTKPHPPVLTIHMGALIDRLYAHAKTGNDTVECLVLGCPTRAAQQQVADRLRRYSIYGLIGIQPMEDNPREMPYALTDYGFLTPRCLFHVTDVGDKVFSRLENGFPIAFPTSTHDAGLLELMPADGGLEILQENLRQHGLHWDQFVATKSGSPKR